MQHQSGEFSITSRTLAEFLDSVKAEEVLLEQRLGDIGIASRKAALAMVPTTTFPPEHSRIPIRGHFLHSPDLQELLTVAVACVPTRSELQATEALQASALLQWRTRG